MKTLALVFTVELTDTEMADIERAGEVSVVPVNGKLSVKGHPIEFAGGHPVDGSPAFARILGFFDKLAFEKAMKRAP